MVRKAWIPALLMALFACSTASADEGMFPLTGVEELPLRALKSGGIELRGRELIDISGAVIQVANGGTGSFVSPDGLMVTNHHVAYGCLAALDAMDEHKGILDSGYVAHSNEQELSCPGYFLMLLNQTRDITAELRTASAGKKTFHERFEAERMARARLIKECEADGKYICQGSTLNGGLQEHLAIYSRILDVRLVYAPEKNIGKYGGDIDNWMYPRHTGDFAFLRAWVAPDGSSQVFDPANVPYNPKQYLKVSRAGIKKDDFVMVMGYPGRTRRFATASAAAFYIEHSIPGSLEVYGPMVKLLEGLAEAYQSVSRRYASLLGGLNNATKYYGELKQGIEHNNLLVRKQKQLKVLRRKLQGSKLAKFDKLLSEFDRIYSEYGKYYRLYYMLTRMSYIGSGALATSYSMVRWSIEKRKPDEERKDDAFKNKNIYRLKDSSDRLEMRVDFQAEAAILSYYIRQLSSLDGDYQAASVAELLDDTKTVLTELVADSSGKYITPAEAVRSEYGVILPEDPAAQAAVLLLARTRLVSWDRAPDAVASSKQLRSEWLDLPGEEFETKAVDPLILFARALHSDIEKIKEGPLSEVEEYMATELQRKWAKTIKAPYPDANFSLRLSFGKVADYTSTATGKTHRYLTTLSEAIEKATGKWPFIMPEALLGAAKGEHGDWHDAVVDDIPINFTSTLDTTGGNSGSPVMDSRGRLVGLLFDGTSESILSDWLYLEKDQRSICVDIRYALFLAEFVHGAKELLEELQ